MHNLIYSVNKFQGRFVLETDFISGSFCIAQDYNLTRIFRKVKIRLGRYGNNQMR